MYAWCNPMARKLRQVVAYPFCLVGVSLLAIGVTIYTLSEMAAGKSWVE